jgi:hypothetical protein
MIDDRIGSQMVPTANYFADDPYTHIIRLGLGSPFMAEQEGRALAELSEDEVTYLAEEDFLLCSPLSEIQEPPKNSPPALDRLPIIPALRLSAPDIEQSIQTLTVEYGRVPSEIEIAHRLGIGLRIYRQILVFLKDLEVETLFAEQRRASRDEKVCCLPTRPEDDPLFGCLRSEMRGLLRDAIEHLPNGEPLVLSFYYSEEADSKTISVRLDPAEPSVSEISASASLTVRASFANPLNRTDTRAITPGHNLHDLRPQRTCAHSSGVSDIENNVLDEEAPQVYVTGSHNGWVPTKLSWKLFGWRDNWNRFFRSWYVINETQGTTEIRRQERYIRELGFDN